MGLGEEEGRGRGGVRGEGEVGGRRGEGGRERREGGLGRRGGFGRREVGSKGRRGEGEAGRTGKGGVEEGWGGLGGRVGVCCPGFPSQEGQDQLGGLTLISSLPLRFKGSREQRGCTHRRQRVHWMEPVLREIPWAQTPQGHLGPGFGHCPDSRSIKCQCICCRYWSQVLNGERMGQAKYLGSFLMMDGGVTEVNLSG